MPVYQVCYDNINTSAIKAELFRLVDREVKDDDLLTPNDPICHAQSSVWFIKTSQNTTGSNLLGTFSEQDIIVTKITSYESVKAASEDVRNWLKIHLKQL